MCELVMDIEELMYYKLQLLNSSLVYYMVKELIDLHLSSLSKIKD